MTDLETIANEPSARNPVRAGIHLAVFTGYTLAYTWGLVENLDNKAVQMVLPAIFFFGYSLGLIAAEEATHRLVNRVSGWYHK